MIQQTFDQPIAISRPYDPQNPNHMQLSEPPFLRNNWKRVFATGEEKYRYVRILRGVANVTNAHVLLRTKMPGFSDGFYSFGPSGGLVSTEPKQMLGFPDTETLRPRAEHMASSHAIQNEHVHKLVMFADEVIGQDRYKRYDYPEVVLDSQGMYARCNSNVFIQFKFPLPFSGDGVAVKADHLKMALTECLRYDQIFIAHENNPDKKCPVFFGVDWDCCALVETTYHSRKL